MSQVESCQCGLLQRTSTAVTRRLQMVLNAAARLVIGIGKFISFREYLRRRHLQPADGILFCFVEAQQAAIQFCGRTRVDNVLHGLLLSAVTEWR